MSNILELMKGRQSNRLPFIARRRISASDLAEIIEAARWAPTAHNMQNFEIVAVDDPRLIQTIGEIRSRISETFLRENYRQMSFSKAELLRKKVGVLHSNFPPSWREPSKLHKVATGPARPLNDTIQGSPLILIVIFDTRKRAPASKGDFLGILSLGCVMENMWLAAQSRGIGFQVVSVFSGEAAEARIKKILKIPQYMKIAYAMRVGYSINSPKYLRVRRNTASFVHRNQYNHR